jgi:hypothetical protein
LFVTALASRFSAAGRYRMQGDDDRARFESALRKAGVWDDLVTVNGQRLKSLWLDEARLAPKARKFLKPFIEETVERQAKLKSGGGQED